MENSYNPLNIPNSENTETKTRVFVYNPPKHVNQNQQSTNWITELETCTVKRTIELRR